MSMCYKQHGYDETSRQHDQKYLQKTPLFLNLLSNEIKTQFHMLSTTLILLYDCMLSSE